jgi:hypothetical protein
MSERILHRPETDDDAERNARLVERWRNEDAAEEAMTVSDRLVRVALLRARQLPGGRIPNVLLDCWNGRLATPLPTAPATPLPRPTR